MPSAKIIAFPAKPKAKSRSSTRRRRIARMPAGKPGLGPLTSSAMRNAAYYTAGCAVIALRLGVTVDGAAINPRWKHEAEVDLGTNWDRDTEGWHFISLAGPISQRRYAPGSDWRSGNHDFADVKRELVREFRTDYPKMFPKGI